MAATGVDLVALPTKKLGAEFELAADAQVNAQDYLRYYDKGGEYMFDAGLAHAQTLRSLTSSP